jgi:hypothetical protein
MYALLKSVGGDKKVLAVSMNPKFLVQALQKDATRVVKEYYDEDKDMEEHKRFLLQSLRDLDKIRPNDIHWDDGEESYLLEYDIVKTRLLGGRRKRRQITTVMAFGTEAVNDFYNCESASDFKETIEKHRDTESLVVRVFKSAAELRAYNQGMYDIDGWEKSCDVSCEFSHWRRFLKKLYPTDSMI